MRNPRSEPSFGPGALGESQSVKGAHLDATQTAPRVLSSALAASGSPASSSQASRVASFHVSQSNSPSSSSPGPNGSLASPRRSFSSKFERVASFASTNTNNANCSDERPGMAPGVTYIMHNSGLNTSPLARKASESRAGTRSLRMSMERCKSQTTARPEPQAHWSTTDARSTPPAANSSLDKELLSDGHPQDSQSPQSPLRTHEDPSQPQHAQSHGAQPPLKAYAAKGQSCLGTAASAAASTSTHTASGPVNGSGADSGTPDQAPGWVAVKAGVLDRMVSRIRAPMAFILNRSKSGKGSTATPPGAPFQCQSAAQGRFTQCGDRQSSRNVLAHQRQLRFEFGSGHRGGAASDAGDGSDEEEEEELHPYRQHLGLCPEAGFWGDFAMHPHAGMPGALSVQEDGDEEDEEQPAHFTQFPDLKRSLSLLKHSEHEIDFRRRRGGTHAGMGQRHGQTDSPQDSISRRKPPAIANMASEDVCRLLSAPQLCLPTFAVTGRMASMGGLAREKQQRSFSMQTRIDSQVSDHLGAQQQPYSSRDCPQERPTSVSRPIHAASQSDHDKVLHGSMQDSMRPGTAPNFVQAEALVHAAVASGTRSSLDQPYRVSAGGSAALVPTHHHAARPIVTVSSPSPSPHLPAAAAITPSPPAEGGLAPALTPFAAARLAAAEGLAGNFPRRSFEHRVLELLRGNPAGSGTSSGTTGKGKQGGPAAAPGGTSPNSPTAGGSATASRGAGAESRSVSDGNLCLHADLVVDARPSLSFAAISSRQSFDNVLAASRRTADAAPAQPSILDRPTTPILNGPAGVDLTCSIDQRVAYPSAVSTASAAMLIAHLRRSFECPADAMSRMGNMHAHGNGSSGCISPHPAKLNCTAGHEDHQAWSQPSFEPNSRVGELLPLQLSPLPPDHTSSFGAPVQSMSPHAASMHSQCADDRRMPQRSPSLAALSEHRMLQQQLNGGQKQGPSAAHGSPGRHVASGGGEGGGHGAGQSVQGQAVQTMSARRLYAAARRINGRVCTSLEL